MNWWCYFKCILIKQKHISTLDYHIHFYSSGVHQKLAWSAIIKKFFKEKVVTDPWSIYSI